eukprot:CAMPEP_0177220764 /NCGR_PEP_ID=MMETSP0367-20130122/37063_1 /TAXON_ID=447022 ORGANISM="Scrippsiella hangoei-like, Strain SHHI-4" /NCGR_SAMPLE_ID=MMETSP0367 /ASSEMBLY_ACC=CAM_ASM_000362 /LENGTH=243 /DNA_ID=CAMNT_0018670565 /DNA_START=91 /DNA_END=823 /DNA_ORIENTATION=-
MVIPLGAPGDGLEREPVPTHVRGHHAKWWWCLFVLLLMSMIIQIAGQAIFSALYTGISAYIVWYMLRDSCKEMSAICLMMLGLMSAMQGVFDLIILCSMLGGRREQHTERTHYDKETGSTEYKVRFEWHPFFDESQGTLYNMQSLARLISPIVMFTAAALCYWSHSYFETEMLENESVMSPGAAVASAVAAAPTAQQATAEAASESAAVVAANALAAAAATQPVPARREAMPTSPPSAARGSG